MQRSIRNHHLTPHRKHWLCIVAQMLRSTIINACVFSCQQHCLHYHRRKRRLIRSNMLYTSCASALHVVSVGLSERELKKQLKLNDTTVCYMGMWGRIGGPAAAIHCFQAGTVLHFRAYLVDAPVPPEGPQRHS